VTSDIYPRFGATVHFEEGGAALFLVVSHSGDPSRMVGAYGGEVVLRMNQSKALVARLTLTDALAMQKEPSIAMVGGIHMDIERYQRLLQTLGATDGSDIDDILAGTG